MVNTPTFLCKDLLLQQVLALLIPFKFTTNNKDWEEESQKVEAKEVMGFAAARGCFRVFMTEAERRSLPTGERADCVRY